MGAHPFWPSETHEPLIVEIMLPFLSHSKILGMDRKLWELWKDKIGDEGPICANFSSPSDCWGPCKSKTPLGKAWGSLGMPIHM